MPIELAWAELEAHLLDEVFVRLVLDDLIELGAVIPRDAHLIVGNPGAASTKEGEVNIIRRLADTEVKAHVEVSSSYASGARSSSRRKSRSRATVPRSRRVLPDERADLGAAARGMIRSPCAVETIQVYEANRSSPDGSVLSPSGRHPRIQRTVEVVTVQARLHSWAKRHGLGATVHPHILRHSFASHVLQSSQDLRAAQEMLGHASISSTQVYTHLDFQTLAKVYDVAHSRARKK